VRVWQGLKQASFEQKRQPVELLIDRVIVSDGEVEIRYVMPTTPSGEQTRFYYLRLDYRKLASTDLRTGMTDAAVQISGTGPALSRRTRHFSSLLPAEATFPLRCSVPGGTRASISDLGNNILG